MSEVSMIPFDFPRDIVFTDRARESRTNTKSGNARRASMRNNVTILCLARLTYSWRFLKGKKEAFFFF